ncbi:alpha-1A adrenergic receptor-like [Lineus longissimus]|uniref:alpha-1A adrenergic receptor-like n=1 Tax=Lineus longissimus TaxID=88925 RepID=UPI00315C6612
MMSTDGGLVFRTGAPLSGDYNELATAIKFYSSTITLIIGFIANTLAVLVTCLPHNRNNVMCFYIRNLAIFDTLTLIIMFPSPYWFGTSATLGVAYCIIFYYFGSTFYSCSLWTVIIIAVDRIIAVRYPLQTAVWCTMKRAKTCTIVLLLSQFAFYIAHLWMSPQFHPGPDGVHVTCVYPADLEIYFIVDHIVSQPVPILSVSVLNIVIAVSLKRHEKHMEQMNKATREVTSRSDSKDNSMTLMLMLVATCLIILLFPFFCDAIIWNFILPEMAIARPDLRYLSFVIIYVPAQCNHAVNFFLYCFGSRYFRKDLRMLLSCEFMKTAKHSISAVF